MAPGTDITTVLVLVLIQSFLSDGIGTREEEPWPRSADDWSAGRDYRSGFHPSLDSGGVLEFIAVVVVVAIPMQAGGIRIY